MGLLFWTTLPLRTNIWKERVVMAITVLSVVVSTSLLVKKAWQMPGFETWWEHHECWGMVLSTAPWSANAILYSIRRLAATHATRYQPRDYEYQDEDFDHRAYEAQEVKFFAYLVVGTLTWCSFLLLNGVFAITHLVPAAVLYSWASGVAIGLGFCIFRLGRYFFFGFKKNAEDRQHPQ